MNEVEQLRLLERLVGEIAATAARPVTFEADKKKEKASGKPPRHFGIRTVNPNPRGRHVFAWARIQPAKGCLRVGTLERLLKNVNVARMPGSVVVRNYAPNEDGRVWKQICAVDEVYRGAVYGLSQACRDCLN